MIFRDEPADFKNETDVVGCYVQYGGEFVLLHRQPHKSSGNKFGLPAGKVDPGESTLQAMQREIWEETGLTIPGEMIENIGSVFVRHNGHDFRYHMFATTLPAFPQITINPKEHQGHRWASPAEALTMDLVHDLDTCIRLYYPV
jgi:8-oxo-dGTP pyrophosphatase MutT (NUDIX family)